MSADRNLSKVLTDVLAVVPAEREVLRFELEHVRENLPYAAPEMLGMCWRTVARVLSVHVPNPTTPWERKMAEIFTGRAA
ncbi:MAG TPA: hypothetical protein VG734_25560 [Lacunisphaera sp.]|nr:hypothetical protein [Lacunisphaera sp.]